MGNGWALHEPQQFVAWKSICLCAKQQKGVARKKYNQAVRSGLRRHLYIFVTLPFIGVDASMARQVGATRKGFATVGPDAAEGSRIVMLPLRMDKFEDVHLGRGTCKGRNG